MSLWVCVWDVDELPDKEDERTALIGQLPFGAREAQRLLRIRNPQTARQSLGGLLALRQLLAHTQTAPRPILRSPSGKPFFEGTEGTDALPFSISHAASLSVAVLGDGRGRVGIDLEFVRPAIHHDRIAARFFNESERQTLAEAENPTEAFFRLWCAKEARGKLSGEGLLAPEPSVPLFTNHARLIHRGKVAYLAICAEGQSQSIHLIHHAKELIYEQLPH